MSKIIILAMLVSAIGCSSVPYLPTCERQDPRAPGLFVVRDAWRGMIVGMQVPCVELMRDAKTGDGVWVVHILDDRGQLASMALRSQGYYYGEKKR